MKGFTIIEITIVIAIAAIAMLTVGSLFITQWQLYRSESAIAEIKAQNMLAQKTITSAIEESFNVMSSSTINNVSYVSDENTIVLKLPAIDSNQDIIPDNFDYVAFERDGTNPTLLISDTETDATSIRPSGKKTIAQFVSTLNFGYNDSVWNNVSLVEITNITQKQAGDVLRESKTFKAVKLKNK
ncbi:MAG: prepilin-type N-terminal cleavage/methylation domain-containing protein [Patescibacteria group bacterium]|nr:prepilin-type N-terminal cleavage/methylation domain-containing protein [Patescibacteria group bacterium]